MEEIKRLISDNKSEEAIRLLNEYLQKQPKSDEAWFLLGKVYYKLGNVRLALNSYLQAIEINPESPAREAYNMAIKVLDFYNKDMYNH
ncbi:tetratricopeptide repeat protein [uncultured Parabacteroides sp.]|uniref:tetratricopeptide repeat protein n=1 Tax=uncultured Parabacteroides sp. TaxID=512312 RepID=UPI002632F01F|nr:tetratricopeptide repeat protein [uncultured Parabacteroides sp.]